MLKSKWEDTQRKRARELIGALEEASQRHGLMPLSLLFRSLMGLASLSRDEALSLGSLLPVKVEELLQRAERLLSEQLHRQTA